MDQKDWKVELRLMFQFKLIINPKNMIVDDFSKCVLFIKLNYYFIQCLENFRSQTF